MICNHTMFTNINSMLKTKLICNFSLWAFTKTHFVLFFLNKYFHNSINYNLCLITIYGCQIIFLIMGVICFYYRLKPPPPPPYWPRRVFLTIVKLFLSIMQNKNINCLFFFLRHIFFFCHLSLYQVSKWF